MVLKLKVAGHLSGTPPFRNVRGRFAPGIDCRAAAFRRRSNSQLMRSSNAWAGSDKWWVSGEPSWSQWMRT